MDMKKIQIGYLILMFFLQGCSTGSSLNSKYMSFSWPLKAKPQISRGFSLRGYPHHGIDLVGRPGQKILSAHQGYVVYAGSGYKGYGHLVIVDSGQGWATFYAHLQRIFVREDHFIERGDVLGTIGTTGKTTGPHLHFELRHHKIPVDPQKYLP